MRGSLSFFIVLLFFSCSETPESDSGSKDEEWKIVSNLYAKGFLIEESQRETRLTVYRGGQDGFNTAVFVPPFRKFACLSTTHASYLAALGVAEAIVGLGYSSSVLDEDVRIKIDGGNIRDITASGRLDVEKLLATDPEVFLTYSYEAIPENLIQNAGVRVLYINEYEEPDLLGRAEWIRVFGRLTGRAEAADSLFAKIDSSYSTLKTTVFRAKKTPTVVTASYYGGQWYVPGAESNAARLIKDAGGLYLFHHKEGSENVPVSFEELYKVGSQADFFGKVAAVEEESILAFFEGDKRFFDLKAVNHPTGLFLCNTLEADYFGRASVEPHVLLADLIGLFHPDLLPNHIPKYFKPLNR